MTPHAPDSRRTVPIADDHVLVRAGVSGLLASSTRYRLVGAAGDVADRLARLESLRPDVLLLDIMPTDMSGIDAVARIR